MNVKTRHMRIVLIFLAIFIIFTASSLAARAQEDEGLEEFTKVTGTLNYILFGLAILILPWRYIYKSLMKKLDSEDSSRDTLISLHWLMKNLHYIVGVLAVLTITYHAYLVISKWNFALIGGLSLIWFYVITGILSLVNKVPSGIKKWTYRLHGSKIYLIITAALLYLGHILAD